MGARSRKPGIGSLGLAALAASAYLPGAAFAQAQISSPESERRSPSILLPRPTRLGDPPERSRTTK